MKATPWLHAERYRIKGEYGEPDGVFMVAGITEPLAVIASVGSGWDHVSVSAETRCPTWDEMQYVRKMFFASDETVVQIHPPVDKYVNCHPYCLHMWRPQGQDLPLPPRWMIAPVDGKMVA